MLERDRTALGGAHMNPLVIEEWNANFIPWCIERTKSEIWEEARRAKVAFMSVFKKQPKETGPALPGGKEFDPPPLKKGEETIWPSFFHT